MTRGPERSLPMSVEPCCAEGFTVRIGVVSLHLRPEELLQLASVLERACRPRTAIPWLPPPGDGGRPH